MKRLLFSSVFCVFCLFVFSQKYAKDIRQTYLWDVTLSMKGFGGAPDIYDAVVDVMIKDIESISNERTEIVVVPFQNTKYCAIWKEKATPAGKKAIIKKIKDYNNQNLTSTNISAPLQYTIDSVFSENKIDILKLLTDGKDNVNPSRLEELLRNWCMIAKNKDVYGYYILLTPAAKGGDVSLLLKEICNFEEVDLTNGKNFSGIAEIKQIVPVFEDGININIRDEYDKSQRLNFKLYMSEEVPVGFEIHFKTQSNPYLEIDTIARIREDMSVELKPHFILSKDSLIRSVPINVPHKEIILEYNATNRMNNGEFAFTRLIDTACNVYLINKPEKTVYIYVK